MFNENKSLKILFISAEVSPFAKTGGLADVAGSLPKILKEMGHDVRISMPRYKEINTHMTYTADFPVLMSNRVETCIIRTGEMKADNPKVDGIPVYFMDNHHYYDRNGIYCHMDDGERFIFMCKAALEMLPKIGFKPDIIHCNDWHTGPLCLMLKEKYNKDEFYKDISTIYTIHNLEYQGNFYKELVNFLNMDYDVFTSQKAEFYGMFSFMKCGLIYSDIINTVSTQYAKEILTSKYGEKMEGILNDRKNDLYGIVNGISYVEFNPEMDNALVHKFSYKNPEGKKINKEALQRELGLPVKDVPLMGIVSRLSGQKALEHITDQADIILKEDVQLVVLGLGDPWYIEGFTKMCEEYPKKVVAKFEFNAELAQRIYASSDIFLMPSRFEPCGLGQIISLRYGTVPVVRATGGLAETIIDYDKDNENGNGFSYEEFDRKEFVKTLKRALLLYKTKPDVWKKLVVRGLKSDFSWNMPASKYLSLYKKAIANKKC
jgi:starch synthase